MMDNPATDRARRKKRMIVALAIVLALAAVALAVWLITRKGGDGGDDSLYSADVYEKSPNSFAVYDPDAPSIFEDEEYLALDRAVHVRTGGEEYTIDSSTASPWERFFIDYFDALAHGDSERCNAMYTDGFIAKYGEQGEFSEQRIYDIHLTLLDKLDDASRVSYSVSYCIRKNNGTFRRDIYSDSSRPVIIDLVLDGDVYKIDNIHYLDQ